VKHINSLLWISKLNIRIRTLRKNILIHTFFQLENMYKKAHENIRSDPKRDRKPKKEVSKEPKRWNAKKLTNAERKQRVVEAKAAYLKELQGVEMES